MISLEQLYSELQKCLKPKRFQHSIGVAYTAAGIAMSHGYPDINRVLLAGLLHDCAKYMSDEELLCFCREHKLPVSVVEEQCGYLLHGKVGAYYAEHSYGVTDTEVLSAVTWHTTGKPNMTFLEQCIFCADYFEPMREQRTAPSLTEIRKTAFLDIDLATFYILENTMRYLTRNYTKIEPTTELAYEYYKQLQMSRKKTGD